MDSNQRSHFASLVQSSSQSAYSRPGAASVLVAHYASASLHPALRALRLRAPLDVFTSQMIIGSESKYDQDKNQDHREGDPDFCVVTVGLEPTVSLRFACSVKFAIGVLLRCRLHDLLLTKLPPRFICHWQRFGSAPNRCA